MNGNIKQKKSNCHIYSLPHIMLPREIWIMILKEKRRIAWKERLSKIHSLLLHNLVYIKNASTVIEQLGMTGLGQCYISPHFNRIFTAYYQSDNSDFQATRLFYKLKNFKMEIRIEPNDLHLYDEDY